VAFTARSIELEGGLTVPAPPDRAFELFSPEGERAWVPGWDPELVHPPGATWERGLIFRTREESGEAIWIVTALDRAARQVEYHRVEPGRWVARIRVRCRPGAGGGTEVRVAYAFIGLSGAGNDQIAAMTIEAYEEKMRRWQEWIAARVEAP
jgi:hypothetical protein